MPNPAKPHAADRHPAEHVLFEDNHLLVVAKWAGIATQGVTDEPSLQHLYQGYLKQKYNKPGNVYLGIVSRLDKLTSGVIVFARTSKAAARLSEQFRRGDVAKVYWAVTASNTTVTELNCHDWLAKSERQQKMLVVSRKHPQAQEARLTARQLSQRGRLQLWEVQLETGRKHQIRVQFAARELPIVGDHKYGSQEKFSGGIALHARSLTLNHPTLREAMTFVCPPPPSWNRFQLKPPA